MIRHWQWWTLSTILGVLGALWVVPVQAGGWAVVTAETWPAQFEVGKPYTIPLIVRQHGTHPVTVDGSVQVVLRNPQNGEERTVTAQPTKEEGRYVLDLTFAAPGQWAVEVQPGWFPPSTLIAQVVAPQQTETRAMAGVWWWSVIPLALAAGYVARGARRGVDWQIAIGLFVGAGILALLGWSQVQKAEAAPSAAEVGKLLFSAKGCVTCHVHAEIATTWSTEIGPNLTVYATDPAWLESWLKDPAGVRPQTKMPNLYLRVDEIASLSAFLHAN